MGRKSEKVLIDDEKTRKWLWEAGYYKKLDKKTIEILKGSYEGRKALERRGIKLWKRQCIYIDPKIHDTLKELAKREGKKLYELTEEILKLHLELRGYRV